MVTKKIFIIFFITLLIVTIVEASYFIFQFSKRDVNESALNINNTAVSPKVPSVKAPQDVGDALKNSAAVSAVNKIIFQGKIVQIDTSKGVIQNNPALKDFNYDFRWYIKGDGEKVSTVPFNKAILENATIVKSAEGKEVPAQISEFKVGDIVRIERSQDLINRIYTESKITKM